jgi:hypothetical protein
MAVTAARAVADDVGGFCAELLKHGLDEDVRQKRLIHVLVFARRAPNLIRATTFKKD